jgi:molybdopterin-guanine dinucleotide biosynthesis protein A
VILAGGRAERFPGKLTADAGGLPMLARVLRNVRGASSDIRIASSLELEPEISALVDVPVVVDGERARGPVGGMLAAFAATGATPLFVVAGDAPFVDAAFATRLYAEWRAGDEALVPIHATPGGQPQSEPLAALYDRVAFLRAGAAVLREGRGALRLVLERLKTRYVPVADGPQLFTNVNTPADYAALRAHLAQENV